MASVCGDGFDLVGIVNSDASGWQIEFVLKSNRVNVCLLTFDSYYGIMAMRFDRAIPNHDLWLSKKTTFALHAVALASGVLRECGAA